MKSTNYWAALMLLVSMALPGSLTAATLVFKQGVSPTVAYTTAIATIRSDQPSTNSDGSGNLVLGNLAATGADLRVLFAFNLSSIGSIGSATINSVQLSWTGAADGSSGSTVLAIDLFQLASPFTETGVTWNTTNGSTAWTTPGGDFSSTLLSSQSGNPNTGTSGGTTAWTFASSANFVSAAQSAFDSGSQTFYFIAKLNDETGTARRIFQILSDENATASNHPALTVTYTSVPEPSAGMLAGVALALWLCLRFFQRPLKS
jgi:hypothetical protein